MTEHNAGAPMPYSVGYYNPNADPMAPVSHTFIQPMPEFTYGTQTQSPFSEPQIPIDAPSFRSLSGIIIIIIFFQLCISLFICLGRTDFNFVLYLLGYYIMCLDADKSSDSDAILGVRSDETFYPSFCGLLYIPSRKMERSLSYYTILVAAASAIDLSWIFIALSTWTCDNPDTSVCFGKDDKRMEMVYGVHHFTLFGSIVNLVLKVLVIVLAQIWIKLRSQMK